jgi:hypothetical protein
MQPATGKPKRKEVSATLVKEREERVRILDTVQGMWKKRRPDPVRELDKIRKEWERVLP